MMNPYPFFGFPNYRRYYRYPYYGPNYMNNANPSSNIDKQIYKKNNVSNSSNSNIQNCNNHNSGNYSSSNNISSNINNNKSSFEKMGNTEEEFFDFFGIRLAFDDLLILALLFCLYKEEAKDPYLYISLILLLLS